jgi:hypothetical protein
VSPFVGTAKVIPDNLSDLPSLYGLHTTHTEVLAPVFGVPLV